MSFKVSYLSDSMLKRLGACFADINYSYCGSVHSVPGSEISKITDLAE